MSWGEPDWADEEYGAGDFAAGTTLTLASAIPALTGDFSLTVVDHLTLAGDLPALTGAFDMVGIPVLDTTLAGDLPALTGAFSVAIVPDKQWETALRDVAGSDLLAWYRLNEAGTVLVDSSGNGHHGVITHDTQGPTLAPPLVGTGGALDFGGNGSLPTHAGSAAVDDGGWVDPSDGLTIGVWFDMPEGSTDDQQRIFSKADTFDAFIGASGVVNVSISNTSSSLDASGSITHGRHFLVFTIDDAATLTGPGGKLHAYLDAATFNGSGTPGHYATTVDPDEPITFGYQNGNGVAPLYGAMDETFIIGRALTQSEIDQLYVAGLEAEVTIGGTLPALTGAFSIDAPAAIELAGSLPALTGAFNILPAITGTLAGDLPALTGAFGVAVSSPYVANVMAKSPVAFWLLDEVRPECPAVTWDPATMLGADALHPNDAGMTYLAGQIIAALDAAGKSPEAGDRLTAYGDSYTAADEQNTAGLRAIHQLRDHYGVTLTNRATSGYRVGDCAAAALTTSTGYTPGSAEFVYLQAGVNDLSYTDSTHIRAAVENHLRAWFATISASSRIEDTSFTYGGAWTAQTGQQSSAGTNHYTTVDGATATYTVVTPGDHYLMVSGTDPDAAYNGGQFTVTQGATVLAVVDLDDQSNDTPYRLGSYGPLAVRLEGVAAGTLTVTFNTLSRPSARGILDALLPVSATPPVIIATKPVYVLQSIKQKTALLATVRSLYDEMALEFDNVVVVDADPGSDVRAVDQMGNHHGWYSREVTLGVEGIPGLAGGAEFGAGAFVEIGDELGFGDDKSFSFVAWVKLPSGWGASSYAPIMGKGNTGPRLARYSNTRGVQWNLTSGTGTGTVNASTPVVDDGEWHQIVGRYNGDALTQRVRLHEDAVLAGSNTATGFPVTNTNTFRLGGNSGASSLVFSGRLCAIAVYDYDLSDADVTTDHDLGTVPDPASTLTLAGDLPALTSAFDMVVTSQIVLNGDLPTLVTVYPQELALDSGVPALTGAFDVAIVEDSTLTLAASLPALTGAFTVLVPADVQITGAVPALTGAFTLVGGETAVLDGTLPALTGAFTIAVPVQPDVFDVSSNRIRDGLAVVIYNAPVDPAPVFSVADFAFVSARAFGAVTMDGAQPKFTVSRSVTPRLRDRIVVGGVDITHFRGVTTPAPTYSLVVPLLYGSGRLPLPQVAAAFEHAGHGDLSWAAKGSTVLVQRVNADNEVVATDYIGLVVAHDISGRNLVLELGGQATGRAAMIDKQPPLFFKRNDLGFWWWGAIQDLGLHFEPRLGPDTGIRLRNAGGMDHLSYVQDLSVKGARRTGAQLTCLPDAREDGGAYRVVEKDLTTISATVYLDDAVSVPDVRDDMAEQPNRIFATGVTPHGMRVKFGAYPVLRNDNPPPYPFDDNRQFGVGTVDGDTDSGDGVSVMIWRLVKAGYLALEDKPGGYDSEVSDAIIDLKTDALDGDDTPTFFDGNMNPEAWAALFDASATGYSLAGAQILPAAQRSATRPWKRTSNGSVIARNGLYDPTVVPVDATIDAGVGMSRKQIRGFARGELTPVGENHYAGTITLNSGAVIRGEHTPGDPVTEADVMDARELRPGVMNLWAPLFAGGTLFHISGIERNVPTGGGVETITVDVDTRARDTLKVWEVIARNRESRRSPARAWMNQHRSSTLTKDAIGEFDEIGGVLDDRVDLGGGAWTVFPTVAGQEGTIRSLRFETSPPTEFVVAVFGKEITSGQLDSEIGNPLTKGGKKRWIDPAVRDRLDRDYVLLYAAGEKRDPCGYFPGQKHPDDITVDTDPDDATEAPDAAFLTGKWQDDAGFSYHMDVAPVLWVAIWAADATHLAPGRVMWPQLEAGS